MQSYRKLSHISILTKEHSDTSDCIMGQFYLDQIISEPWYSSLFTQDIQGLKEITNGYQAIFTLKAKSMSESFFHQKNKIEKRTSSSNNYQLSSIQFNHQNQYQKSQTNHQQQQQQQLSQLSLNQTLQQQSVTASFFQKNLDQQLQDTCQYDQKLIGYIYQYETEEDLVKDKQIMEINLFFYHKNIVKTLYIFENIYEKLLYVFTEISLGGCLNNVQIQKQIPFDSDIVLDLLSQICQGLQHAHYKHKFFHGNISLENIFLTTVDTQEIIFKLGQFSNTLNHYYQNQSKNNSPNKQQNQQQLQNGQNQQQQQQKQNKNSNIISMSESQYSYIEYYDPPECYNITKEKQFIQVCPYSVDIYQLGIIVCILSGVPVDQLKNQGIKNKKQNFNTHYDQLLQRHFQNPLIRQLVSQMIQFDPQNRISLSYLITFLQKYKEIANINQQSQLQLQNNKFQASLIKEDDEEEEEFKQNNSSYASNRNSYQSNNNFSQRSQKRKKSTSLNTKNEDLLKRIQQDKEIQENVYSDDNKKKIVLLIKSIESKIFQKKSLITHMQDVHLEYHFKAKVTWLLQDSNFNWENLFYNNEYIIQHKISDENNEEKQNNYKNNNNKNNSTNNFLNISKNRQKSLDSSNTLEIVQQDSQQQQVIQQTEEYCQTCIEFMDELWDQIDKLDTERKILINQDMNIEINFKIMEYLRKKNIFSDNNSSNNQNTDQNIVTNSENLCICSIY